MNIYFTQDKPPVTAEKLREIEQKIGCDLPGQYKEFLFRQNGGRPKPCRFRIQWNNQEWAGGWKEDEVHFFLSVHDGNLSNFLDYYDTFKGRIPNDTVPVAYDPGGNLVLLGVGTANHGRVFFWKQSEKADYRNVGFVADSFNEFIGSLFE